MTSPTPSITTRMLDFVFGKTLQGEARERAAEERPPAKVRHVVSFAWLIWIAVAVLSFIDWRGWADLWPAELPRMLSLAVLGFAARLLSDRVSRHYRQKARRERDRKRANREQLGQ